MPRHYDEMIDEAAADHYRTFAEFHRLLKSLKPTESPQRFVQNYRRIFSAAASAVQHQLRPHDGGYGALADDADFLSLVTTLSPPTQKSLTAKMLYHLALQRHYRRFYCVRPAVAERLLHTELRGLRTTDLRLPYPACYLEVPRIGLQIWNVDTQWHDVVGIYVAQDVTSQGRVWGFLIVGASKGLIHGIPDDAILFYTVPLARDQLIDETLDAVDAVVDVEDTPRDVKESFRQQKWRPIFRWVMNLAIYLTSADARVTLDPECAKASRQLRAKSPKARKAAQQRWRRLGHTMIVGHGVPAMRGHELSVRTLVSGHWKNVSYGPGRQQRRRRFIEPYWRGPDDATVSDTQHRV